MADSLGRKQTALILLFLGGLSLNARVAAEEAGDVRISSQTEDGGLEKWDDSEGTDLIRIPELKENTDGAFELQPDGKIAWAYIITTQVSKNHPDGTSQFLQQIRFFGPAGLTKTTDFDYQDEMHMQQFASNTPAQPTWEARHGTMYSIPENPIHVILHDDTVEKINPGRRKVTMLHRVIAFSGEDVATAAKLPTIHNLSSDAKWGYSTPGLIRVSDGVNLGHPGQHAFFPHKSGGFLLYGAGTVALYDDAGSVLWSHSVPEPNIGAVVFSPSNRYIAVFSGGIGNTELNVFDRDGRRLWSRKTGPGLSGMQFTPDERFLFAVIDEGNFIFHADTGEVQTSVPHSAVIDTRVAAVSGRLNVSISSDGTRFLVAALVSSFHEPVAGLRSKAAPYFDIIYWLDMDGHVHRVLRKPHGFLCWRGFGSQLLGPIAMVSPNGREAVFLTHKGVMAKPLE